MLGKHSNALDPLKNITCPSQQQINWRGKARLIKIKTSSGWEWAVRRLRKEVRPPVGLLQQSPSPELAWEAEGQGHRDHREPASGAPSLSRGRGRGGGRRRGKGRNAQTEPGRVVTQVLSCLCRGSELPVLLVASVFPRSSCKTKQTGLKTFIQNK